MSIKQKIEAPSTLKESTHTTQIAKMTTIRNRFQPLYMDSSSEEETAEPVRSTTPPYYPFPATPTEIAYVKTLDDALKQNEEPNRFRSWTGTETSTRSIEPRTTDSMRFPSFKATSFPRKPVKILSVNSNSDFPSLSTMAAALPSTSEPKVRWKDSFAKKVEDLRVKEEAEDQRTKEEAESQRRQNLFLMNTLAPRFRRRIEDIMQEETEDHDADNVAYYPEEDTFVAEPEEGYDDADDNEQ